MISVLSALGNLETQHYKTRKWKCLKNRSFLLSFFENITMQKKTRWTDIHVIKCIQIIVYQVELLPFW